MAKANNEFILGPTERASNDAAGASAGDGEVRRMVAEFLAGRASAEAGPTTDRGADPDPQRTWLQSFLEGPDAADAWAANGDWRARFAEAAPSPSMLMAFAAAPVAFLGVALFAAMVLDPAPAAPGREPASSTGAPLTGVAAGVSAAGANPYPRQRLAVERKGEDRRTVPTRSAALGADRASLSSPAAAIELPEGARVVAIALDGDRLAVHVDGPESAGVIIYDALEGRVVAEVPFAEQRGDAPQKTGARNP